MRVFLRIVDDARWDGGGTYNVACVLTRAVADARRRMAMVGFILGKCKRTRAGRIGNKNLR